MNKAGEKVNDKLTALNVAGETDIGFIDGGILVKNFNAYNDAVAAGDPNPPLQVPLYRLALTTFQNKQGLVVLDGAAYHATIAAGNEIEPSTSGSSVYGDILGNKLESSNIDVAKVALDMALMNRGFSAIQGVIDDVNKVTNNLISKLAG